MSAAVAQEAPVVENVETKIDDKTTESFVAVIRHKIRAGIERTKQFGRRTARRGREATVHTAKATWTGTKKSAHWIALAGTGALSVVGNVLSTGVRWGCTGLVVALDFVLLTLIGLLTGVFWVAENAVYVVNRLFQLVGLVLVTPWIAVRYGKTVLKEDWEIMRIGLRPHLWHVMHPSNLAALVVRGQETAEPVVEPTMSELPDQKATKQERTAESDGQGDRPAVARSKESVGKGRPTPRRATRRTPTKVPKSNPAASSA